MKTHQDGERGDGCGNERLEMGAGMVCTPGDLSFCQTDGFLAQGEVLMAQRCQPAGVLQVHLDPVLP